MLTSRIYLSFEDGSFYSSLQKIHLADNLLVFKMINTLKKKSALMALWRRTVQFTFVKEIHFVPQGTNNYDARCKQINLSILTKLTTY